MSDSLMDKKPMELRVLLVDPQPEYIKWSGRWHWPFPEVKPHPEAVGVMIGAGVWYWAWPHAMSTEAEVDAMREELEHLRGFVGGEMLRSDYQTVDAMRSKIELLTAKLARNQSNEIVVKVGSV